MLEKIDMVTIPSGESLMGDDLVYTYTSSFKISRTPITNKQYLAFVKSTNHRSPDHWKNDCPPEDKLDHPVVHVAWDDAMAYCEWLTKATGKSFTLPSESMWEKAARGPGDRAYPWGNETPTPCLCNFNENVGDTTPVGKYSPEGDSVYGCADMAGNVLEWTASSVPARDGGYVRRILRGGSFASPATRVRCTARFSWFPDYHFKDVGFRVVL